MKSTAIQSAMFCSVPFVLIPETALLSDDDQATIVEFGLDANHQGILMADLATGRARPASFLARARSLARAQALDAADGGQVGLFVGL